MLETRPSQHPGSPSSGSHPFAAQHAQQPHLHPQTPTLRPAAAPAHGPDHPSGGAKITAPPNLGADDADLSPLTLVEDEADAAAPKKIRAMGVAEVLGDRGNWKRTPHAPGTGACRVKSFHGRLSDQGMGYMDDAINEWLDKHPGAEVKFVTSNVGVFEGKMREPALIVNLWF